MVKTAVVTGAARGLGRALAAELAGRKYRVIGVVRQRRDLSEVGGIHPLVEPVNIDVGAADCRQRLSSALAEVDAVDILLNNAGIVRSGTDLLALSVEDVIESFLVNCVGALQIAQACLPKLLAASRPTIVNVSSRLGSISGTQQLSSDMPASYAYRISKAAQNMLSACLHHELSPFGVRVFAVHPGELMTRIAPPDATTLPTVAAGWLVNLAEGDFDELAGRFIRLPTTILEW